MYIPAADDCLGIYILKPSLPFQALPFVRAGARITTVYPFCLFLIRAIGKGEFGISSTLLCITLSYLHQRCFQCRYLRYDRRLFPILTDNSLGLSRKNAKTALLWIDVSRKVHFYDIDHLCYWDAPGAIFGCARAQYQATRSCTHDIGRSGTEEVQRTRRRTGAVPGILLNSANKKSPLFLQSTSILLSVIAYHLTHIY